VVMDPQQIGEDLPAVLRKYNIKAIPTVHNGISYRSRTEARWAVFFETLGLRFTYEAEGYDLGGVWYLPDFWFPDHKFFVEIKPDDEPTELEMEKAVRLAEGTGHRVFVFFGMVHERNGQLEYPKAYVAFPDGGADYGMLWCECEDCGACGIEFDGRTDRLPCKESYLADESLPGYRAGCPRHGGNRDKGYNSRSVRLVKAFHAFRSVRFGR